MRVLRQPLARPLADDRGSMAIAMLITMVATGLSVIVGTLMIAQIGTTRFEQRRVDGLQNARAGLEVAVATIQASTSGGVSQPTLSTAVGSLRGDRTKLPCAKLTDAPSGSPATYAVSFDYYTEDPQYGGTALPACQPGKGPVDEAAYVLLTSTGIDPAGKVSATLTATYPLLSGDRNLAGDTIRLGATNLCLDAGDSPAVGQQLSLSNCAASTRPRSQLFAYGSGLQVRMVSSSQPGGLCVDAQQTSGASLTLAACGTTVVPASQQWVSSGLGASGGGIWTSTDQTLCWRVTSPAAGSRAKLDADCGNASTFVSRGSAGAGAAVLADRNQWVDYAEFSRCLDVSGGKVADARLITYPCRQGQALTSAEWSQQWVPLDATSGLGAVLGNGATGVGNILFTVTDNDGSPANPDGRYCLWSPGVAGQKAQAKACSATTAGYRWTVTRNTGQPVTSYRIEDDHGLCLTAVRQDVLPDAGAPANASILRTMTCDGSDQQKWNAPPAARNGSPLLNVTQR
ncbi:ricin-type beta-trefoil lectin domain protein [Actinoplanes oblitus]|uniref:Ricin-type beta-trefoil lectin domain protein n=1 Tax=Actinoplanes oblitus TaxID=3040509 RepID=A0ABY8WTP1_9ACTN|nr:ricin-type beta-trefoil lectin domain protein [Actinoplanes oblitus]WIN00382.1 ricin-type beta-trefoil lectin domain protein [Actinoplanes oblitus]